MRKLTAFLLALLLVLCGAVTASAEDGNVTYSGDSGKFIFEPGTNYSPTDLFPDLKDVMPGDVLTQRIVIRNAASRRVDIRINMRSLGAHPDSVDFLSQMRMTVTQLTDTELFNAPADQSAQLTDWVCLGTVASGGTVELEVRLEVPVTMTNEHRNLVGYLDWQFMVEEFPAGTLPQTGDDMNFPLYIGLMGGALVAIVVVVILMVRRKKKDEE